MQLRYFIVFLLFPFLAFAQSVALPPTSIVSARIVKAEVQADGRMNVREEFTDNTGQTYYMDFRAPVGATATMRLMSDAGVISSALGLANSVGAR